MDEMPLHRHFFAMEMNGKKAIIQKMSHKPQNVLHLLPPAPGFNAGGRDAVPGRPALLPGLPLLV